MTKATDHAPDQPFGCTVTWGPAVHHQDMGLHVCNRPDPHGGLHECKCGSKYTPGEQVTA